MSPASRGVQVTMLVQVPEHDNTVLTSGGTQSTVGADSDGVDVTGVTQVVNWKLGRQT